MHFEADTCSMVLDCYAHVYRTLSLPRRVEYISILPQTFSTLATVRFLIVLQLENEPINRKAKRRYNLSELLLVMNMTRRGADGTGQIAPPMAPRPRRDQESNAWWIFPCHVALRCTRLIGKEVTCISRKFIIFSECWHNFELSYQGTGFW